ncbi:MAG: TolC family protein [Gammaproteobacteria bacterium]|nr:TolC family protein [Gammaproteobacteria bacterium]
MPATDYTGVQAGVSRRLNLPATFPLTPQATPEASRRAQELLAVPLTPTSSVQLALLQSPSLRAEFAGLGVAHAELVQAGLLTNPRLAVAALRPEGGGRWQLDLGLSQSLLDLLTRPLRRSLAEAQFEAARLAISAHLTNALQEVQQAYFEAVGAQHRAAILAIVAEAAATGSELATRFRDAGNLTELDHLLEATEATRRRIEADAARAEAEQARRRLAARLGVADAAALRLPGQLPDLPDEAFDGTALVAQGLRERLDLQIARQGRRRAEQALALYGRLPGMTELDLGLASEREPDGEARLGPELSLSLPLFDQGQARLAAAEAELRRAESGAEALELQIGHDIGAALAALEAQRERARRLRQDVIPQRERILELTLRNYNFMLAGAFQVLLAKQQEYEAYTDYVDALAGYWGARVRLTAAVGGGLPVPATGAAPLPGTNAPAGMGHPMHGDHGGMDHPQPGAGHEGMDHSRHGMGHDGKHPAPTESETGTPPPEDRNDTHNHEHPQHDGGQP